MENEEEILLKRREIERMSNKQHQKSFIWKSLFRTWAYSHISNEKKWKKKIFSIYTKPCHVNHIRFLMLSIPLSNIYVGIYHLNWRKFCLFQEFMCFFYHLFLFIRSCLGYIFFFCFPSWWYRAKKCSMLIWTVCFFLLFLCSEINGFVNIDIEKEWKKTQIFHSFKLNF